MAEVTVHGPSGATALDVAVVVGTFGDDGWRDLAVERAIPSAAAQCPVVHAHADTLADARNAGLAEVSSEFVIHLDADDRLSDRYVEAMGQGTADIRGPSVHYVQRSHHHPSLPRVAGHRHECSGECLPAGNWLVVGSCVRTEVVRTAGGWWNEPIFEDWSLWLRCYLNGASVEAVPDAVYEAFSNHDGRNHALPQRDRNLWHHRIVDAAHETVDPWKDQLAA